MERWLVEFRSHAEGLADVHCVDAWATSSLRAIVKAVKTKPPLHPWVLVRVYPWPNDCSGVVEAAEKLAGMKR